jgi:hypothetical protein
MMVTDNEEVHAKKTKRFGNKAPRVNTLLLYAKIMMNFYRVLWRDSQ